MSNWCVYKITCKANGKPYIGITSKSLQTRLGEHIQDAFPGRLTSNGTLYALHSAIQKHGQKNFIIEPLMRDLSFDEARENEVLLIKKYNSYGGGRRRKGLPRGYNQSLGGEMPDFGIAPKSKPQKSKSNSTVKRVKRVNRSERESDQHSEWQKKEGAVYGLGAIAFLIVLFGFFSLVLNVEIAFYIFLYLGILFAIGVIFKKF